MNQDKKLIYTISFLIVAALTLAMFLNVGNSRIVAACMLLLLTGLTYAFIRKKSSVSVNKKEVILLSVIIGTIYFMLVQMSGLFFGFYKNPYFVTPKILGTMVLPIAVIIITSELIRARLLAQKKLIVDIFAFLACVLAEILEFSNLSGITTFNRFMDLVGLTLFPAISANIFYNYAAKRFGALPNILFRMILALYVYFVPKVTAMADALLSCINILLPIMLLSLVSALFDKKKKFAKKKGKKVSTVATILTALIAVAVTMLISCQFRFGALIIATESMTGEINKGDMIIYERYDDQTITVGQVIVFRQEKNKIIHRVVEIETIGDEVRYYTKGDANETNDVGYRTEEDIIGLTDMKVAYIGYPTLWLRSLLEGSN